MHTPIQLLACTAQLREWHVQDLLAMATLRKAHDTLGIIASTEKGEKHHHCLAWWLVRTLLCKYFFSFSQLVLTISVSQ